MSCPERVHAREVILGRGEAGMGRVRCGHCRGGACSSPNTRTHAHAVLMPGAQTVCVSACVRACCV
eukprot:3282301-Rhodomonas_salina.1